MNPKFSVILPFYRQNNFDEILRSYAIALERINETFEIIAVVNASSANPGVEQFVRHPSVRVTTLCEPGWGRVVKAGIQCARGDYICYANSARANILEFIGMLEYARLSNSTVVTSKRMFRDSWLRGFFSWLYSLEVRLVLGVKVMDVNATPKIIPRNLLNALQIISDGDLFDAELLYQLQQANVPIIEIPVFHWKRNEGKSTTNMKSAIIMLLGVPKIRLRYGI